MDLQAASKQYTSVTRITGKRRIISVSSLSVPKSSSGIDKINCWSRGYSVVRGSQALVNQCMPFRCGFTKNKKDTVPFQAHPLPSPMDPLAIRQAIHDAASKMRGAFLREDPQVQLLCASSQPPHHHIHGHVHTHTTEHLSSVDEARLVA